jgi:hypothetical protein
MLLQAATHCFTGGHPKHNQVAPSDAAYSSLPLSSPAGGGAGAKGLFAWRLAVTPLSLVPEEKAVEGADGDSHHGDQRIYAAIYRQYVYIILHA